jgi:ribosome-binding factor A
MGRKGISVPSEFSTEIIDAVQRAIDNSGMSNAEVIRKANISQDYYYTRTRYEKPFNTNDISRIAAVIGIDPYEIINEALFTLRDIRGTT